VVGRYQALDAQILADLYLEQGLSLQQVADHLGPPVTKRVVQRALQFHGIPLRPARPPARRQLLMSAAELHRLYEDEGRSLPEVAAHFGVTPATVIKRMRALGIERRKGAWRSVGDRQPLTRELLHELRVVQRLSAAQIAEQLGYSRIQVSSALQRHGVGASWRRDGSLVERLGAGELWWLHNDQGLPVREIARRLSTSGEAVGARMRDLGLPIRAANSRARQPRTAIPMLNGRPVPTPDHDLLGQVLAEARARLPQPRSTPTPFEQADPEELRRLHHDQALGLYRIARMYRVSGYTLRGRFEELGIEIRDRRGPRTGVAWKPDQLLRLAELYARADVRAALTDLGVPVREPGSHFTTPVDLTQPMLQTLYGELGLTVLEVGLLTDRGSSGVARALHRYGYAARRRVPRPDATQPPGAPLRLTAAAEPLRVDVDAVLALTAEGLGAQDVARALGISSATTVRIILQVMEVPQPGCWDPPPIPQAVLAVIHREGISPAHAATVFDPRHRGIGHRSGIPAWPWPPDPAVLDHLYRDLGLGLVEIANRLRVAYQPVREAVRAAGIPLRHEADHVEGTRRWRFDLGELRRLYVEQSWSSARVAAHLGVSEAVILRVLHRHHMPVTVIGGRGERRVRYDELLAHHRVLDALTAAGLSAAPPDPPILRRALPETLLRTLLDELRLSTFDVELLTGRPTRQVRRDAEAHGIRLSTLPPGVTVEQLRTAYHDLGWSLLRICREFNIAGRRTLFSVLDEAGIPRRDTRANPWHTREPARSLHQGVEDPTDHLV
jgi:DNA-binding CsgD family transcriptional regulator